MTWTEILFLSLALGADAFSVSAAIGLTHRGKRSAFRIVFHFALFQGLLALVGALAGTLVLHWIAAWDHWLVMALLGFVGGRMVVGAIRDEGPADHIPRDLTRGMTMVGLSLAVSIDALAAGISLPAAGAPILPACGLIALVTLLMSMLAWRLAGSIPATARRIAEGVAGCVLLWIGLRTLIHHLA